MNKLFSLKKWVSLNEAAEYLSTIFNEDISVKDFYRLALDGHIMLSVNFVNGATGKRGKLKGLEELTMEDTYFCPIELAINEMGTGPEPRRRVKGIGLDDNSKRTFIRDDWDETMRGYGANEERPKQKITTIDGVWDILPVWNGRLELEHLYYQDLAGISSTMVNLEGILLSKEGVFFELYQKLPPIKMQDINRWNNESLEYGFDLLKTAVNIDAQTLSKINRSNLDSYYPAPVIPDDAIWCVRTDELSRFIKAQTEPTPETREPKELNTNERNSLHALIYALTLKDVEADLQSAVPHDTGASKTDTASKIKARLDKQGINLTAKTIREHIKNAHETAQELKK